MEAAARAQVDFLGIVSNVAIEVVEPLGAAD